MTSSDHETLLVDFAAAVAGVRTAAQTARIPREPTREPGASPLSDALAELREDER